MSNLYFKCHESIFKAHFVNDFCPYIPKQCCVPFLETDFGGKFNFGGKFRLNKKKIKPAIFSDFDFQNFYLKD